MKIIRTIPTRYAHSDLFQCEIEHPTDDRIRILFTALVEHEDPRKHFDHPRDISFALSESNAASWFCAKVTASFKIFPDLECTTYLGCCSYVSFDSFIQSDDYIKDMVDEACEELFSKLMILKRIEV